MTYSLESKQEQLQFIFHKFIIEYKIIDILFVPCIVVE